MVPRATVLLCVLAGLVAGCSKDPERATVGASPTAPTALSETSSAASGPMALSGPLDVLFPQRNEALDFRQQLETKYQTGLRRPVGATAVDLEGEVVWTGEYFRYRINGCDHATAIQRVFAQIDGGAAGAICSAGPGGAVAFPPRDQALDFRRQLETKYQGLGRSVTMTAVDAEGSVVWTQEYLRYRTNACGHAASAQNVFTQIDGNAAPATCYVPPPEPCAFRIWPSTNQTVPDSGGSSSVELVLTSGRCTWTATTNVSWITLTGATTGGDREVQTFTAARNTGAPRTGFIYFTWAGGGYARLAIDQGALSYNLSFQLFDYSRSINAASECQIRMNPHTCTLSSATNALPSAIATYDWRVEYSYGSQQVKTQASASSTFTFTQVCGGTETGGAVVDLSVRLTVTDTSGNTATIESGQGFQPPLTLRIYPCS